jgi:hypothetical protein
MLQRMVCLLALKRFKAHSIIAQVWAFAHRDEI